MELNRTEIYFCRLISRDVRGGLDPEERERLAAWLAESPRNMELYRRFADRHAVVERLSGLDRVDVKKYAGRFEHAMKANPLKRRRRLSGLIPYAAAAVLVAVIAVFAFTRLATRESDVIADDILPGTFKAVLVTGSGEVMALGDGGRELQPDMQGLGIRADATEIDYSTAHTAGAVREMHKIVVPRGGEYIARLHDGTRVYLNSESKLTYPVSFGDDMREVALEGEGYFEVAADMRKPFVVNAGGMRVRVLGTTFNLRAYADEDYFAATLIEGSVEVSTPNAGSVLLAPAEQVSATSATTELVPVKVDVRQYAAYKDGQFVFREAKLEDIMKTLMRWYDFDIVYKDEKIKGMLFSGRINRQQSIRLFLEILETTKKIKVSADGRTITLELTK